MSQSDRDKWNNRYREGAYATRKHPSVLLVEWLPRILPRATPPRALDIACGTGRNALYLARHGWRVDAVDISDVALDGLNRAAAAEDLDVECIHCDLETGQGSLAELPGAGAYDLAVMFRYTNLPLIAEVRDSLKSGGYLLVEAHLTTDAEVAGPQDPRFRVAPGALREAAAGLEIVACHEGILEDPDRRPVALAQLVARKTADWRR